MSKKKNLSVPVTMDVPALPKTVGTVPDNQGELQERKGLRQYQSGQQCLGSATTCKE